VPGGGPLPLISRLPREHTYTTSLHVVSTTTDISTSNVNVGMYFTVGQFNGATALTNVFDQYMIRNVTVTWMPQCVTSFITSGTVATVAPTGVYNHNILITCVDTDDANTPTENGILDHESMMVHGPFVKPFSRSCQPAVAAELYQTGGFGGYGNRTNQWIDSASTAVQHYGIKYNLNHGSNAPTGTVLMVVYVQATISFRKRF
jgi:hypothetical protein